MNNQKPILLSFFFWALISGTALANNSSLPSKRFEILSGQSAKTEKTTKLDWDKKYAIKNYVFGKAPAEFLAENYSYIPEGSKVLDVGMGEGRNAVFLAQKGFEVTGIDISSVAIKKAQMLADELNVRINTIAASIHDYDFPEHSFDAIICYYFVDRALNKKILKWLKPGGVLVYEAHTLNQIKVPGEEHYNRNWLLKPGELLSMFEGSTILKYEEPLNTREFRASIIVKR
jgi:tellurite methyltransferase